MKQTENADVKKVKRRGISVLEFLCLGSFALIFFCVLIFLSIGGTQAYTPRVVSSGGVEVRFHIDSMEISDNHLSIVGWSFVPYEEILRYQTHILLRDVYSGEYIKLPTAMQRRADVTQMFYDPEMEINFDYYRSGWLARVNVRALNQPLDQYEIIILYQNNGRYIPVETERRVEVR